MRDASRPFGGHYRRFSLQLTYDMLLAGPAPRLKLNILTINVMKHW